MKKLFLLSTFLCVLLASCSSQNLKICVEKNFTDLYTPDVFYWVKNDTGTEIKNIEWSLNGIYFYTADLPVDGGDLDLFEFAKSDGTRYDFFSVKPIELKAKCSKGHYSVKFDDIEAIHIGDKDYFVLQRETLSWSDEISTDNKTADGVPVLLSVVFGYKSDDKAAATKIKNNKTIITDYLRRFIAQKLAADFAPKNEDSIKTKIKNDMNNEVLPSVCIQYVAIMNLDL